MTELPRAKRLWMTAAGLYLGGRNTLFRVAPGVGDGLMRLTRVGGRGGGVDGDEAARYFTAVVDDYARVAEAAGLGEHLFRGRTVMELGPGDTRAVALLARLRGAESVDGCDRFDIQVRDHDRLRPMYERLLALSGEGVSWADARRMIDAVRVFPSLDEARDARRRYDLVISRAVLEHVRDVEGLHRQLREVTTPDAVIVHKVDLRSHGFELDHPLDFLLFSERRWSALTSHIGEPNRLRAPSYVELARRRGFTVLKAWASKSITAAEAEALRPSLAEPFRSMPASTLAVLGVWLVMVREGHPLAARAPEIDPDHLPPAPSGLSRY
ncbi:MAG: class I SAM-dependent methyltransferase [Polyangiales bacterium]